MSKTIRQIVEFAGVTAKELFNVYVDAKKHAEAIGAPVTMSRKAGAKFEAFGKGRVQGKNLLIIPGRVIVQSWRAQPWKNSDPDSILVLAFSKSTRGAKIDLVQAAVPDQAYDAINDGWHKNYWKPWREYLRRHS